MNNAGGSTVQLRAILEVDELVQHRVFVAWAEQAGVDLKALENEGCGCCVDIYTLSVSPAAAKELEAPLGAVGSGVDCLPHPT